MPRFPGLSVAFKCRPKIPKMDVLFLMCCIASSLQGINKMLLPVVTAVLNKDNVFASDSTMGNAPVSLPVDPVVQGWVFSSLFVGMFTGALFNVDVKVIDRVGSRRALGLAMFLASMSIILTSVSENLLLFGVMQACQGISEQIGTSAIVKVLSNRSASNQKECEIRTIVWMSSLGLSLSFVLPNFCHWRKCFLFTGAIGFIWTLFWFGCFMNKNQQESLSDEEMAHDAQVFEPAPLELPKAFFMRLPPVIGIMCAHFSMSWFQAFAFNWFPSYLMHFPSSRTYHLAYLIFPFLLNSSSGGVVCKIAENLIHRGYTVLFVRRIMTGLGLTIPALILIGLTKVYESWSLSIVYFSISMFFITFNTAGHLANHSDLFAPQDAAQSFNLSSCFAALGGMLSCLNYGFLLLESSGRWFPPLMFSGVLCLMGSVIYWSMSRALPIRV